MPYDGKDIADRIPPPDKLGKGKPKPAEGDEAAGQSESDEDKTVRVGAMQELLDAISSGDAETACDKLDTYLDIVGR